MSILNVNFGKSKQFLWDYPAKENSKNKDVRDQVRGMNGEPCVDGWGWSLGVYILILTPLDFDANFGQMEMAPVMFLDLPGVLIFWQQCTQSYVPLLFRPPIVLAFLVATAIERMSAQARCDSSEWVTSSASLLAWCKVSKGFWVCRLSIYLPAGLNEFLTCSCLEKSCNV